VALAGLMLILSFQPANCFLFALLNYFRNPIQLRSKMYLLELYYENAKHNRKGRFSIEIRDSSIPKWTLLHSGKQSSELFRMAALSLTGIKFLSNFAGRAVKNIGASSNKLQIEAAIARHPQIDGPATFAFSASGVKIDSKGIIEKLASEEIKHVSIAAPNCAMTNSSEPAKHFFIGLGPQFVVHGSDDDIDFNNSLMRIKRFETLFYPKSPLTDPVQYLTVMNYRAKYKKIGPSHTMKLLTDACHEKLNIDTTGWMKSNHDFQRQFDLFPSGQKRMLAPLIDICRHMTDAFPKSGKPLNMPGLLLLQNPNAFCHPSRFLDWILMIDEMFPNLQIVVSLPKRLHASFPQNLSRKRLELPRIESKIEKKHREISSSFVLLVHVDGRFPNLALMKLSRYFKNQGKKVLLTRKSDSVMGADAVFASCIFTFGNSAIHVEKLSKIFGDSLNLGGSGVDVRLRLDENIERLEPDYSLYPELGDRAIGFLTRGCPRKCPFCIVPVKEGRPLQVSDINGLLQGGRSKLVLLDDNILAHPEANSFLEEMVRRDLRVNFTQTLDLRLIDRERAGLLRRIRCENTKFTRPNYYFSLNDDKNLDLIAKKYRMFNFRYMDNVEFVCMHGFNTTLAQDVRRFAFLRSLPGAYVFVQKYQPIPGGPPPIAKSFFDDNADELINELVEIIFTQNMKSMETYYRWVGRLYAEKFGKLHVKLTDALFKYNHRHRKGDYIASLAGTRKRPFSRPGENKS
jgi:hypothetical protein